MLALTFIGLGSSRLLDWWWRLNGNGCRFLQKEGSNQTLEKMDDLWWRMWLMRVVVEEERCHPHEYGQLEQHP